ncbi:MAG TPA: HNH endonuclease [Anaerolineae bacterium]|nr:HNH endonuclease [Anaerolineae bacterium]
MASVLLLNMSYEPLGVITHKRALSLMMRGRVEAACEEALELKAASHILYIPKVIRLRRYINVPHRSIIWSRKAVLRRDKYTCAYCGVQVGDYRQGRIVDRTDFSVDHVIPVSKGGKNTWGNTVCACAACNQRKADRTPHEANMKLLWEPKTPRVTYLVASGEIPAAWKTYLEVG